MTGLQSSVFNTTMQLLCDPANCGEHCSTVVCSTEMRNLFLDMRRFVFAFFGYWSRLISTAGEVFIPAMWVATIVKVVVTVMVVLYTLRSYVRTSLRTRRGKQAAADPSFDKDEINVPRFGAAFWGILWSTSTLGATFVALLSFSLIVISA